MRQLPALLSGLILLSNGLSADTVYSLRNAYYFPDPTNQNLTWSGALNSSTVDSKETTYSTNPGDPSNNSFDGVASINGSPLQMSISDSLTLGSSTTATLNLLTFTAVRAEDTTAVITGGAGSGYLLPTFRVQGALDDPNPSVQEQVYICAGIGSCILQTPVTSTGGPQSVDFLYTPAADGTTAFTFNTPFDFFYFYQVGMSINGGTLASPGPAVTASFEDGIQLVGYEIVNADGTPVRGAVLHSDLVSPEPSTAALAAAGLLIAGAIRFTRRMSWPRGHRRLSPIFHPDHHPASCGAGYPAGSRLSRRLFKGNSNSCPHGARNNHRGARRMGPSVP